MLTELASYVTIIFFKRKCLNFGHLEIIDIRAIAGAEQEGTSEHF